jgi:chromosome segregation ATPase
MSEAEGRINELNGKYSKSLKESELLSEKLDVASKELTHERSSLLQERKSHTEIVNQLKSQIDEAKLEKERLFDRVTELEVERNESLEDLATASKEQNQMAEALARCKHELASSNKVIAETKEHTETLNEQKKTQSEELKRLEGELTAQVAIAGTLVEAKELAERTLHDITAQRDELFQRICSLTADLKKAHEENTNTSKTLSELNSANDRLRTQSSEMSCRLVTLQADLADSAASNLQLSALIANSDDEAGRLRAELDSIHVRKGSDSALLEKEMAALRDQLKCSKDANVQLRLKLSDVEAKYDELNGELRVNETHKSKLLCTLQESEGESQVLRTKLCAAKGEILCLQDRVSGLRTTPAKH